MTDLVVIVPTRGRPQQLARLASAVTVTTDGRVDVLALVDDDDPYRGAYLQYAEQTAQARVVVAERRGLVGSTNLGAEMVLGYADDVRYLASLGDDHVPRTMGWDLKLIAAIEALPGPGWAYGNDLLQGKRLPTAWVQHRATVDLLGWMMMPTLQHMYPDNVVLDVAGETGRLAYCPDVVIEHLHPAAGKAAVDESYAESNRPEQYAVDRRAYTAWQQTRMYHDRDAVRGLTWAAVPSC